MARLGSTVNRFTGAIVIIVPLALSACQSTSQPAQSNGTSALKIMERVALAANQCWFKSADPAFTAFRLAPELNSYTGRPRILLVEKNRPEGLPLLVVQAEGNPARTSTFGPLLTGTLGERINRDVSRWVGGGRTCT